MLQHDLILALFYSDEDNLVFDNIKYSKDLPDFNREILKTLSLRFLGPLFLTAEIKGGKGWNIDLIETSLSQYQSRTIDADVIQSFFILNSSIPSEKGTTHLFLCIGSPYTEDVKIIYDLLSEYIHPVIIQGKFVNESMQGSDFDFNEYIHDTLKSGVNLINYFLGAPRKMYWEEQQKYYCIGSIEREISEDERNINKKISNLFTFDVGDPLIKISLKSIPSFYVMAILPDYYENRISETLKIFNKTSVYPNIRMIRLSNQEKKVIYLEEYLVENGLKKSYGVILIPENEGLKDCKNLAFYTKHLRLILDKNENKEKMIIKINSKINPFDLWDTMKEDGLEKIKDELDNNW
jgi:hypothetical protein